MQNCSTGNKEPSQALPRQLSRRESQAVTFVAKVLGIMRKFPAVLLPLPLRKDFPRSGGRCRAATKGGVWHRAAMTERAHTVSPVVKVSDTIRNFNSTSKSSPFGGAGCDHREQPERVGSLPEGAVAAHAATEGVKIQAKARSVRRRSGLVIFKTLR